MEDAWSMLPSHSPPEHTSVLLQCNLRNNFLAQDTEWIMPIRLQIHFRD